ncbi:MAG: lysophospholipid acyltransferase family protein [Magnetospiraceae bacterium]
MTALRSLLFNIWFYGTLVLGLILMIALLPFHRMVIQESVRTWVKVALFGARVILGLRYKIRGIENLPKGAAIVAAKHQSAWDTLIFYLLAHDPAYVLKKELIDLPVWGWHARKAKAIAVDRSGGGAALKKMLRDVRDALEATRLVVIFPEGTRTKVGQKAPYHPGIAALYRDGAAPVVPVALNSGLFWGRRQFKKYGGVITLEILPPIPADLDRKAFMARLQSDIETATGALVEEARAKFPHLPPPESTI